MGAWDIYFEKAVNKGYVLGSKILFDKPVISIWWKKYDSWGLIDFIDAEMMVIFILITNHTMTDSKVVCDK